MTCDSKLYLDSHSLHARYGALLDLLLRMSDDVMICREIGGNAYVSLQREKKIITVHHALLHEAMLLAALRLPLVPDGFRWHRATGFALARLLERTGAAMLTRNIDPETGEPAYQVGVLLPGRGPVVATADELVIALLTAQGQPPVKYCEGCQQDRALTHFSKLVDSNDGRNRYCRTCERARVKQYSDKRKAEKAEAAKTRTPPVGDTAGGVVVDDVGV